MRLADLLVSQSPVPTGLPLTSFMVLTTITSAHCLKSCRQLLSFWELCLEEELPRWALCPSAAYCTLRVEQAGMSLWLFPSRAHHSCSFPPISRSWMGSCCLSCCSPRAWVCSAWLGTPTPAPLCSGKKFCTSRHTWVKSPAGALCIGMQLGVPAAAPMGPLPGLFALNQSSQPVQPMGSDGQLWFLGPAWLQHVQAGPRPALGGLRFSVASSLVPFPEPLPSLSFVFPVPHRALLRKLGGLFLPSEATLSLDSSEGVLARAVVHAVSAPSGCVFGQARA